MPIRLGLGIGLAQGTGGEITPPGPPLEGLSPTAAYSTFRNLTAGYEGAYYTETSGRVSAFLDQSGNTRDLAQATAGNRPVIATVSGRPAIDFDGAARALVGPNLSNFIAADAGTMVMSFISDTAPTGSSSGAPSGGLLVSDAADGGNIQIAPGPVVRCIQYDGAYKYTPGTPFGLGEPTVVTFRKTATTLGVQVNQGEELSLAVGDLTALAFALYLSDVGGTFDGQVFEFALFNTDLDDTTRGQVIAAFMSPLGISVPDLTGFPNADTTGTSGTLAPSSGTLTITTDGAVVENLDHAGNIVIDANGVTVRNCRITDGGFTVVQVALGRTGAVVEDCEIDGEASVNGPTLLKGSGTFRRNNLHSGENGIVVEGVAGCVIEDNYVHDLLATSADPHYDCIELNGGQTNVTIEHNTLDCGHGQTSAINVNNFFGAVDGITITDNLLTGGGYTVYVVNNFEGGAVTNVAITDNYIGRGAFGYFELDITPTTSNNRDAYSGGLIS